MIESNHEADTRRTARTKNGISVLLGPGPADLETDAERDPIVDVLCRLSADECRR